MVIILMESLMEKANTNGKTDKFIMESSRKGKNMVKANGRAHKIFQIVIFMMASTLMI
jgi:hypothetical protein